MKTRFLAPIALALLASACAKVTPDNYSRIEDGMSEQDVITLLGKPSASNSIALLGFSGTSSRWVEDNAAITVRFVNGRVALKSFESK
jgi:hypothetical protein